jgi:Flp pilus assembly protein TadD
MDRDAEMRELLDRYEAGGGEELFEAARPLYEAALAERPHDTVLLRDYGYLLECHGRLSLQSAAASYRRALELDPSDQKTRWQLLHADASLGRHADSIAACRALLAERPEDVAAHRFLAYAHLAAGDLAEAEHVVAAGLALAPADAVLIELQGDAHARAGRADAALDRWREALRLDPENLSPSYSTVFLLQDQGRLEEAAAEWRAILAWSEARGYELDAEWPRRELARLEAELAR